MPIEEEALRAEREKLLLRRAERAIARKNTQFIIDHQHDAPEELSAYLRACMDALDHVPAKEEVIGGDYLEYRFGSWTNAIRSVYTGSLTGMKSPPPFAERKIVREACEEEAKLLNRQFLQMQQRMDTETEKYSCINSKT